MQVLNLVLARQRSAELFENYSGAPEARRVVESLRDADGGGGGGGAGDDYVYDTDDEEFSWA